MEVKDVITIIAILVGPIVAVIITLQFQNRHEKRVAKLDLFLTLMKGRHSIIFSKEYVDALNNIDVIFHDVNEVRNTWGALYDNYNSTHPDLDRRVSLLIDLLSQMAIHLGYSKLTQMQINRYYIPQAQMSEMTRQNEIADEALRVLKATENYGTPRITPEPSTIQI